MKNILRNIVLAGSFANAGGSRMVADIEVSAVSEPVNLYLGIGTLLATTDFERACSGDKKDRSFGGIVKAGYSVNDYLDIEARFFMASQGGSYAKTTHYGIYLKPKYNVFDSVRVYGLLGYGKTKVEFKDSLSLPDLYNDSKASFGVGIEYKIDSSRKDGVSFWAEYQNLLIDEGIGKVNSNVFLMGVSVNL